MSQEKPGQDPRKSNDKPTFRQSDQPWDQPVEQDQTPGWDKKPDLEKWDKSQTK